VSDSLRIESPGAAWEAVVERAPSGLVGTIGVRVIQYPNVTVVARRTTGIVEAPAGSGIYAAAMPAISTPGQYATLWDTGGALSPANVAGEDLVISATLQRGLQVAPGQTFTTTLQGGPSGLAGTIGVRILDNIGGTALARSTTAIVEFPAGSGFYMAQRTAPATPGEYSIVWDAGGAITPSNTSSDDLTVTAVATPAVVATGMRIPPSLYICDREIVNPARTIEYVKKLNDARFHIDGALPSILYRLGGTVVTFVDPALDPAPWYDSSRPESSDFLGVILSDLGGLDSSVVRTITDLAGEDSGSAIGPLQVNGRQMPGHGYIVAKSYCGIEYGKRWLIDQLAQDCNGCSQCEAQVRLCAPPDDGSNDQLGSYRIANVALLDGPLFTADECPDLAEFTFTLGSEKGWLYHDPEPCMATTTIWPGNDATGACLGFDEWMCGNPGPANCCTVNPPLVGTIGAIITVDCTLESVSDLEISTYANCPPLPDDTPITTMSIPVLMTGSQLEIDSAKRTITYLGPDGTSSDGTPYIALPEGELFPWLEIDSCHAATCICAQISSPCGGGAFSTVRIDTQLKEK
jgi:hypothetical protein